MCVYTQTAYKNDPFPTEQNLLLNGTVDIYIYINANGY